MKKICRFCQNALQNKLGIWLAIDNVGVIVLNYATSYYSVLWIYELNTHIHSENCLTVAKANFTIGEVLYHPSPLQILWTLLNFPALLTTKVIGNTLSEMFPQMCIYTLRNIENWTTLFSVVVQWIVVGYLISLILQKRRKLS